VTCNWLVHQFEFKQVESSTLFGRCQAGQAMPQSLDTTTMPICENRRFNLIAFTYHTWTDYCFTD
jgi:hypothetical protein